MDAASRAPRGETSADRSRAIPNLVISRVSRGLIARLFGRERTEKLAAETFPPRLPRLRSCRAGFEVRDLRGGSRFPSQHRQVRARPSKLLHLREESSLSLSSSPGRSVASDSAAAVFLGEVEDAPLWEDDAPRRSRRPPLLVRQRNAGIVDLRGWPNGEWSISSYLCLYRLNLDESREIKRILSHRRLSCDEMYSQIFHLESENKIKSWYQSIELFLSAKFRALNDFIYAFLFYFLLISLIPWFYFEKNNIL